MTSLRHYGLAALGVIAALALATTALAGGNGSIVAPLRVSDATVEIQGAGCGVPATATLTLPAGASNVQVRKPAVGGRNSNARLTDVSVQGNVVTFTAVGDGSAVCGDTPNEPWFLDFGTGDRSLDVAFNAPTTVAVLDEHSQSFKVRPRTVPLTNGPGFTASRVRWKRFGGSKAIGFGTIFGGRVKLTLTRPSYCPGQRLPGHVEDAVFYGQVVFIGLGGRQQGLRRAARIPRCEIHKNPTRLP
jgi:hypothetical protein